jgi:hypothetical protein
MMRDLVQHDAADVLLQQRRIVPVQPFERAAVDRDLVGEHAAVARASARQRHTLVQAEQRPALGGLLLDDDLDVRHLGAKLAGQRVERLAHGAFETVVRLDVVHLPRVRGRPLAAAGGRQDCAGDGSPEPAGALFFLAVAVSTRFLPAPLAS